MDSLERQTTGTGRTASYLARLLIDEETFSGEIRAWSLKKGWHHDLPETTVVRFCSAASAYAALAQVCSLGSLGNAAVPFGYHIVSGHQPTLADSESALSANSSLSALLGATTEVHIRTGLPGTNAQLHELDSFHTTQRSAEAGSPRCLLRPPGDDSRTSSSADAVTA